MMNNKSLISNGSLWASAFLLIAMIIFTASKHTQEAQADAEINGEGFTLLTTSNGQGSEYLFVIDDNAALLMVYGLPSPQNQSYIKPIASWALPAMFNSARN